MQDFEALAAFANLGDKPSSWQEFRLGWPHFFAAAAPEDGRPSDLAELLYKSAKDWDRFCSENSEKLPADYRSSTVPVLLWYRELLRSVWKRSDPTGAALCCLLGFQAQARISGIGQVVPVNVWHSGWPLLSADPIGDILPPGAPIVEPPTLRIRWQFGCQFQRALYALIESLWLAKICPQCGKYFIAGKTAQKFCTSRCYGNKKSDASLEYYHQHGKYLRQKQGKSVKKPIRNTR